MLKPKSTPDPIKWAKALRDWLKEDKTRTIWPT